MKVSGTYVRAGGGGSEDGFRSVHRMSQSMEMTVHSVLIKLVV